MTTTSADSAQLRARLVDHLVEDGFLHEPRWREAFLAIPREEFVDRFTVHDPTAGRCTHHDLTMDRAGALAAVYSDVALVTQLDSGGTATSSSTTPSLMALMLERLDVYPDIGCWRSGPAPVTTPRCCVMCSAIMLSPASTSTRVSSSGHGHDWPDSGIGPGWSSVTVRSVSPRRPTTTGSSPPATCRVFPKHG